MQTLYQALVYTVNLFMRFKPGVLIMWTQLRKKGLSLKGRYILGVLSSNNGNKKLTRSEEHPAAFDDIKAF